ncbi:hypothetical protein HRbin25_00115 [bacterium HR25]|jgi:hypothetical protein|nr:hypothetical protein HRbin25_00115 [bacterium HR25]
MALESLGKLLVVLGLGIALLGGLLLLVGRIPFLGRLPGDILVQRDNFTFFFPLATSLLISLVLTIVINVVLRLLR